MNAKCNLIIDSCCDLPPKVVDLPGVELAEFPFVDDEGEHFDDLWRSEDMHKFYERMKKGSSPVTSQVPPIHMRDIFEKAAASGVPTLYLSFSSALSSHFGTASTVLQDVLAEHPSADVRIVDTRLASTAEALIVYEALRKREEGATIDELEQWANEARFCVEGYFMVDELDALRRGGRIPKVVAFAGSKLKVKPILTFDLEGGLAIAGAARGRNKGIELLAEKLAERIDILKPAVICMGHADCEKDMGRLWQKLQGKGTVLRRIEQPIGPVIGSHVGPGMLTIAFWGRDRRKR